MASDDFNTPKYKSIDDILEALKEHSGDRASEPDNSEESSNSAEHAEKEESAPSHIRTAKELSSELSAKDDDPLDNEGEEDNPKDEKDPLDDEEDEAVEDEPKSNSDSVEDETPPQKSQVFGVDDDEPTGEEDSEEDPEPRKEEPETDVEDSKSEPTYNLGNHPLTNAHSAEEEESSAEPESPPKVAEDEPAEHNFDDLVSEPEAENLDAARSSQEFNIPRIKPSSSSSAEPNLDPNLTGFQARRANNFNTKPFDYTLNEKPGGGNKIYILVLAIIGLIVIGGTIYFLKSTFKGGIGSPTPSPSAEATPAPTSSPEPTPTPIDRATFKIRVLNGTSQSGLAAEVAGKLKALGYQIDRTGNATNSAFTQTVIRTKSAASDLASQLVQDLSGEYKASASGTLKDSDPADGEVILGK